MDPVTAYGGDQGHFNRYSYAYNNPYKFTDPDGRCPVCKLGVDFVIEAGIQYATTGTVDVGSAARETIKGALNPAKTLQRAGKLANLVKRSKTFQTYTKPAKDPTKHGDYSGRTSGTGTPAENVARRDAGHHMNDTHGPAVLDKSSSNPDAIRGREQQLIEASGGAQSTGGTSGNAINGVSPTNKKGGSYMRAADEEFKGK